jgi:hypothetical protein
LFLHKGSPDSKVFADHDLFKLEWIIEVYGEGVVDKVGLGRWYEGKVGELNVMAVTFLVPPSVDCVEALRLLA